MTSLSDKNSNRIERKNGKQFVMGISIESTVKFDKMELDVKKHNPNFCYPKDDPG